MEIAANIAEVQAKIRQAQANSPHAAQDVTLLAVSKTKPLALVEEAAAAGQLHFAENRVQELVPKQEARPDLRWHLIGHLQTNKAKYIVDKAAMLHSLDSLALAEELQKRCAKIERTLPVLVQVNIAEEASKSGITVAEVPDFLEALAAYPLLRVQGLMTIGPIVETMEEIRPVFAALRRIKEEQSARNLPHLDLRHLSMGMSGDYPVAVEEGATMVRVGSSIFGARG